MSANIKKILVIEDDEADRYLTEHVLAKFSKTMEVFFTEHGEEALEVCMKEDGLDAIILDINMPIMTGHEFLEVYCEKFPERKIPVFTMLTSADSELEKQKSFRFPVVKDYIVKPLTLQRLKDLDKAVGDFRR